jgi:Variant SH3 domain
MAQYVANADYQETDRNPLFLKSGDEVTTGVTDRTWPGWVWAENSAGNHGYVPEGILEPVGEGRFAAIEDFDPTVLTVKRGDSLLSLRQVHEWHWCRNVDHQEGWVADYLLKKI